MAMPWNTVRESCVSHLLKPYSAAVRLERQRERRQEKLLWGHMTTERLTQRRKDWWSWQRDNLLSSKPSFYRWGNWGRERFSAWTRSFGQLVAKLGLNLLPPNDTVKAFMTLYGPDWLIQLPRRLNFSTVGDVLFIFIWPTPNNRSNKT